MCGNYPKFNFQNTNFTQSFICNDKRLGLAKVPNHVDPRIYGGYIRFGLEAQNVPRTSPAEFLGRWTDNATGYYRYPPNDGAVNGSAQPFSIPENTYLDRIGQPGGMCSHHSDLLGTIAKLQELIYPRPLPCYQRHAIRITCDSAWLDRGRKLLRILRCKVLCVD